MKFARLLCCLWIVALLGQGFAVSAQSLSLHLPSVTKVKLSQAESPRPKHCPSEALQTQADADNTLHRQAEVTQHSHDNDSTHQHTTPEQSDSQPNCCSGDECDMNCRHQNGDSPCSANCDLVQISTLVLMSELNSHQPIALLSESPRHVRYWLDSPLLARQTPPPK